MDTTGTNVLTGSTWQQCTPVYLVTMGPVTRVRGNRSSPDMARDSPEPQTVVRRKRGGAGVKEAKSVTRKEKKSDLVKDGDNIPADIQEELTEKLENLLERDRLGVSY